MLTKSLHENNRLIRKTILKMYPSCFASMFTISIQLMMDTLLAGAFIGQQAIAAVAIGLLFLFPFGDSFPIFRSKEDLPCLKSTQTVIRLPDSPRGNSAWLFRPLHP